MPKIYPPSLTMGPGKRVGTGYSSGAITGFEPNTIKGLARNDRSLPFSASSASTNLYFDIYGATSSTPQTFSHIYLITENVRQHLDLNTPANTILGLEVSAGTGGSFHDNLYTAISQGIRLNNGAGRVTGTNRSVWKLDVSDVTASMRTGTVGRITITTLEAPTSPFYIYACYFLSNPILTLQNDDKTSFSAYRATSNPRTGVMQEDLYGTSTYQQSINRSDKRQVNFTAWRVDDELVLIDRWLDSITQAREQYPNIILDEEFITNHSSGNYVSDAESNDLENFYPATWSTAITDQIEGSGAKSVGFQFQQS